MLSQLQGLRVQFPNMKDFSNSFSSSYTLIELTDTRYRTHSQWKSVDELVVGDCFECKGKHYLVRNKPVHFCKRAYVMVSDISNEIEE